MKKYNSIIAVPLIILGMIYFVACAYGQTPTPPKLMVTDVTDLEFVPTIGDPCNFWRFSIIADAETLGYADSYSNLFSDLLTATADPANMYVSSVVGSPPALIAGQYIIMDYDGSIIALALDPTMASGGSYYIGLTGNIYTDAACTNLLVSRMITPVPTPIPSPSPKGIWETYSLLPIDDGNYREWSGVGTTSRSLAVDYEDDSKYIITSKSGNTRAAFAFQSLPAAVISINPIINLWIK